MGRCNRGRGKAGAAKRRWQARPVLASVPGATAAQKRCGCDATVAQTVPWRDAARHPRRKQAAAQHGGGRGTGGAKSRAHVAQLGKTSTNASKPFPAGRKPLGLAEAAPLLPQAATHTRQRTFSSSGLRGLTAALPGPHARAAGKTRCITVGAAPATPPPSISKRFSIHLHLIVLYIEHYSQILPAFQRHCSSISFNPCRTGCGLF